MLSILVTLNIAGIDTGDFSLYSDSDGYAAPFETGVSRASLLSGYTSVSVPYYLPDVYPTTQGRNMIPSSVSSQAAIDAAGYYRTYPTDAGAYDRDATSTTPPITTTSTTTTTTTAAPSCAMTATAEISII